MLAPRNFRGFNFREYVAYLVLRPSVLGTPCLHLPRPRQLDDWRRPRPCLQVVVDKVLVLLVDFQCCTVSHHLCYELLSCLLSNFHGSHQVVVDKVLVLLVEF